MTNDDTAWLLFTPTGWACGAATIGLTIAALPFIGAYELGKLATRGQKFQCSEDRLAFIAMLDHNALTQFIKAISTNYHNISYISSATSINLLGFLESTTLSRAQKVNSILYYMRDSENQGKKLFRVIDKQLQVYNETHKEEIAANLAKHQQLATDLNVFRCNASTSDRAEVIDAFFKKSIDGELSLPKNQFWNAIAINYVNGDKQGQLDYLLQNLIEVRATKSTFLNVDMAQFQVLMALISKQAKQLSAKSEQVKKVSPITSPTQTIWHTQDAANHSEAKSKALSA